MSCCVRRRCDGMGPDAVGCWSWEVEDAGRASCLRLYASWRRLSCGRTRVPELASWARADGGGGGAPAFAAALPPAWLCGLVCNRLLRAVVVLQKSFVQVLERAKGRDAPSGGILDVVARQPYLLSRAGESAQEGDKPGVGRVCCGVPRDSVVGDAASSCDSCRRMSTQARSCRFHLL